MSSLYRERAVIFGQEDYVYVFTDQIGAYTNWYGQKIRLLFRDADKCWVAYRREEKPWDQEG